MDAKMLERSFKDQVNRCWALLGTKGEGYANDQVFEDRLHNFRAAGALLNANPMQALQGFLAKHTIKLNDMLTDGRYHPPTEWQEVITDSLNYLFLLNALLVDGEGSKLAPDDEAIDPYPQPAGRK